MRFRLDVKCSTFDLRSARMPGLGRRFRRLLPSNSMVDGFPKTRLSAVVGSASPDATTLARSFDVLAACYFAPAL
jgi:hypothetical protein